MIRLVATLAFTMAAVSAIAQVGPSTLDRPCAADRDMVRARGAIVLSTGPDTYGRYVQDGRYCQVDQYPQPAWVPSSDTAQCFVGYRCNDGSDDDF